MSYYNWKFYPENFNKPASKPVAKVNFDENTIAHVYWRKQGIVVMPAYVFYFKRFKICFSELESLVEHGKTWIQCVEEEILKKSFETLYTDNKENDLSLVFHTKYLKKAQKEEFYQLKYSLDIGIGQNHQIDITDTKYTVNYTINQILKIVLLEYWKVHEKYPNISKVGILRYIGWWIRQQE